MRFGAVALVLLGARSALAFPSSRLVYMRGPGAESCPDQTTVREAVKKRLGYDPFFPSSDKTIVARIVRDANKLRGEVELVDEQGTQAGKREFSAEPDQCQQLVHAMALSISIAIDPNSAETYAQGPKEAPAADPAEKQQGSQPEPEAEVPPTPVVAPAPAPPAKPAAESAQTLWSAGLGATFQVGSMPHVAIGATAFAALRMSIWSLSIEGELDAPMTTREKGVELRSYGGALKLVPCGHWKALFACQISALRWLAASGSVTGLGGAAPSLALGARLGAELPLNSTFGVLGYGDLLLTALPVQLKSESTELWKTPLFSGGLGIAAALHF